MDLIRRLPVMSYVFQNEKVNYLMANVCNSILIIIITETGLIKCDYGLQFYQCHQATLICMTVYMSSSTGHDGRVVKMSA